MEHTGDRLPRRHGGTLSERCQGLFGAPHPTALTVRYISQKRDPIDFDDLVVVPVR